jgi:Tfp pilus assembly protein PilF
MSNLRKLLDEALVMHRRGQFPGALTRYEEVLRARPADPDVLYLKGLALLQSGRAKDAGEWMEKAVARRGNVAEWWRNLGVCRQQAGDPAGALTALQKACQLDGSDLNLAALAKALLARGEAGAVARLLEQPSARPAASFELVRLCAYAASQAGNARLARSRYEVASQLVPGDVQVLAALGGIYLDAGEFERAAGVLALATRYAPDNTRAWLLHASVMVESGSLEEASDSARRALELDPASAGGTMILARVAEARGDFITAADGYRTLLSRSPLDAGAAMGLARIDALAVPATVLDALDALRADAGAQARERARACFVLAQVKERHKDLAGEVALLRQGNALMCQICGIDFGRELDLIARERNIVDAQRFADLAGLSAQQEAPVFILGMPRSGTTLTEQVLAAHPRVKALGETMATTRALEVVFGGAGIAWPDLLSCLDAGRLETFSRDYLDRVGQGGFVVTDKAIGNWRFAGLLALAFPRARFIDCRRHPFDNAVGCFRMLFRFGQDYTYDPGAIVKMFQAWHATMTHWHTLFGERIHVLQYEKLVDDQESETRALLDFCGLPWDDRCLDFQQADRAVVTASSVQVRQGLNRDSIERWRRYEALFPEFAPLLALG